MGRSSTWATSATVRGPSRAPEARAVRPVLATLSAAVWGRRVRPVRPVGASSGRWGRRASRARGARGARGARPGVLVSRLHLGQTGYLEQAVTRVRRSTSSEQGTSSSKGQTGRPDRSDRSRWPGPDTRGGSCLSCRRLGPRITARDAGLSRSDRLYRFRRDGWAQSIPGRDCRAGACGWTGQLRNGCVPMGSTTPAVSFPRNGGRCELLGAYFMAGQPVGLPARPTA